VVSPGAPEGVGCGDLSRDETPGTLSSADRPARMPFASAAELEVRIDAGAAAARAAMGDLGEG
jgi:hypothetical protein